MPKPWFVCCGMVETRLRSRVDCGWIRRTNDASLVGQLYATPSISQQRSMVKAGFMSVIIGLG